MHEVFERASGSRACTQARQLGSPPRIATFGLGKLPITPFCTYTRITLLV